MVWKLIEKWYISKAQGRAIEIFFVSQIATLIIAFISWIEMLLTWGEFSFKAVISAFVSWFWIAFLAWFKKYVRDQESEMIEDLWDKKTKW